MPSYCAARRAALAGLCSMLVAFGGGCGPGRTATGGAAPHPATQAPASVAVPAATTLPAAPAPPAAAALPAAATLPVADAPAVAVHDLGAAPPRLGSWVLAGRTDVYSPWADQGVATRDGTVVVRGELDVTPALAAAGWVHVGDPDSWRGWVVDAYQGGPGAMAKMFRATAPDGTVTVAVHPLAGGEALDNSFAAVSPDGRWTVSGEWGVQRRLLVFPTPGVVAGAGPLVLAGVIPLDHPVRNVQGCAFVDAGHLLCSTADAGRDLWPSADQLLRIDLSRQVGPTGVRGSVSEVGPLPQVSACAGTYEPEGIDVDRRTGVLRVEVLPPGRCGGLTQVWSYLPGR